MQHLLTCQNCTASMEDEPFIIQNFRKTGLENASLPHVCLRQGDPNSKPRQSPRGAGAAARGRSTETKTPQALTRPWPAPTPSSAQQTRAIQGKRCVRTWQGARWGSCHFRKERHCIPGDTVFPSAHACAQPPAAGVRQRAWGEVTRTPGQASRLPGWSTEPHNTARADLLPVGATSGAPYLRMRQLSGGQSPNQKHVLGERGQQQPLRKRTQRRIPVTIQMAAIPNLKKKGVPDYVSYTVALV